MIPNSPCTHSHFLHPCHNQSPVMAAAETFLLPSTAVHTSVKQPTLNAKLRNGHFSCAIPRTILSHCHGDPPPVHRHPFYPKPNHSPTFPLNHTNLTMTIAPTKLPPLTTTTTNERLGASRTKTPAMTNMAASYPPMKSPGFMVKCGERCT